jgi:hypothetical protein
MSDGGPNPYQSPQSTGPEWIDPATASRADAASRVFVPALALLILAPIHMLAMLGDLIFRIVNAQSGNIPIIGQGPGAAEGAMLGIVIGGVVDVVAILCQIAVAFGAVQMMKLRARQSAYTACVVSCIPCITGCCLVGIPFGIWGLIVLSDERVKRSFSS